MSVMLTIILAVQMANKIPMFSISEPPVFSKKAATTLFAPQPVGSIQ